MRLIVRYTGTDTKPELRAKALELLPSAQIVDETSRMMLIETENVDLDALKAALPECIVEPERLIPMPTPPMHGIVEEN